MLYLSAQAIVECAQGVQVAHAYGIGGRGNNANACAALGSLTDDFFR